MHKSFLTIAPALTLVLAACGGQNSANTATDVQLADNGAVAGTEPMDNAMAATNTQVALNGNGATAAVASADGKPMGTATVVAENGGLSVRFTGMGLPPGVHGVHIHTTGKCEGPKFESAGGHWNPTNKQHGSENPQGMHAGDLPNLTVDGTGSGTVSFAVAGAQMTGPTGLLDADGAAFMVHASADDNKTDPSGDSGGRIACGVFAAGAN